MTDSVVQHLNKSAVKALSLSHDERIAKIRSPRWIGYPKANEVISKLEDLLVYPKTHRMPNLLLVGETNNGKTMLKDRFCKGYPAIDNIDGDGVVVPVLDIQAPPIPNEGRFYSAILDSLFAAYKPNDSVDKKQAQVIQLLKYVNVRMLVIDEIQHILAGSLNVQRGFLNVIKYLGNELQIPIVGLGTKEAFRAIQTDPQLSNRFEPVVLPLWGMDKDFLRLLASFERLIPLRLPSQLHMHSLATKIHAMSEGYLGEVAALLVKAAVKAVKSGEERITEKLLDELDWSSPSKRKRQIERVR